ncbi:hypothetical protein IW261DRAFT_1671730 [Armillaria novae-zelandiae]|uniref:Uncharacterized protein n=1 Tax=Armillaria novae-zelandiae TaxID=153914 RepID=A0AA39NT31_9AGAR|nr:hypothetical protein IW261DRAFT_1671730 [Armillaria novae-zelandiae]
MKLLVIAPFLLLHPVVSGQLMNHTIDDTLGDEVTGFKVQYSPLNASAPVWKNAMQCADCGIIPDRSSAMNGTWTGATYNPISNPALKNMSAELKFHGSAIYIYLIVSNYPVETELTSNVFCDFRIDGAIAGSFSHITNGSYRFAYNVLAYSTTSLKDDDHTFLIESTGTQPSYIIFDYALYSYKPPSLSLNDRPSPTSSIASDSIGASRSSTYPSFTLLSSTSSSSSTAASGTLSTKSVKALTVGVFLGILTSILFVVLLVLVNLSTKKSLFPLFRAFRQPDPVVPGGAVEGSREKMVH